MPVTVALAAALALQSQSDPSFKVHDLERPQPPVVAPGMPSTQGKAGTAPSDAIAAATAPPSGRSSMA